MTPEQALMDVLDDVDCPDGDHWVCEACAHRVLAALRERHGLVLAPRRDVLIAASWAGELAGGNPEAPTSEQATAVEAAIEAVHAAAGTSPPTCPVLFCGVHWDANRRAAGLHVATREDGDHGVA